MPGQRIVITGPGRSGTTLLVLLLDALGMDTGIDDSSARRIHDQPRAGLETNLLAPDAPGIVKDPNLTWRLRTMIESGRVDPGSIAWIVVPMRPIEDVAASRIKNSVEQRSVTARGGLAGTAWPWRQRDWLAVAAYGLFETIARYEIPLILLEYPRFAVDPEYAFRRLTPMLGGCTFERFQTAWRSVVNPELIRGDRPEVPRFAGLILTVANLQRWFSLKREGLGRRFGARR